MALTKVKASNITLTTAAASSNDTTPATTQYVTTAINNLIDGAPATLNTLDEIAAALNDDAALNTTLTNAIAAKMPLAGGTFTGDVLIEKSGNPSFTVKTTGAGNNPFLKLQAASNYWEFLGIFSNSADELDIRYNGSSKLEIDNSGNATFAGTLTSGRMQPNEHIIFQSSAGYLQFPGSSSRAWAMASQGGSSAPGTNSATFGFHHWSGSAWSNPINITASGKLGVGTDNPEYNFQVNASNVSSGGGLATVGIFDSGTAYNGTQPGGGIAFRGKYNSSNAITNFGTIQAFKENGADGDYGSSLILTTRANGGNLTEKFRIVSNGNIGIGTGANVDELLHLEKSSGTTLVKTEVASNSTVGFEIAKTGATTQRWRIVDGQTVNGRLEIHDATDSRTDMTFDGSGNVGIGEVTPLGKLHVKEGDSGQGSVNSNFDQLVIEDDAHSGITILSGTGSDGAIYFGDSGGNNRGQFKYQHGSDQFAFVTSNGANSLIIKDNNLHLTHGADARIQLSNSGTSGVSTGNNTVHIRGDNDHLKLNAAGNGHIIFEENGTQRMFIRGGGTLAGNVSIGTHQSPYGILHIQQTSGNGGFFLTSTAELDALNAYQIIQTVTTLSGSNTWTDVAYVGHSPVVEVRGRSVQSSYIPYGGANATYEIHGVYGSVANTAKTQRYVAMNGGDVTGNIEYMYDNSGYKLRVRMPYSGGTHKIYTTISGLSAHTMYEL